MDEYLLSHTLTLRLQACTKLFLKFYHSVEGNLEEISLFTGRYMYSQITTYTIAFKDEE